MCLGPFGSSWNWQELENKNLKSIDMDSWYWLKKPMVLTYNHGIVSVLLNHTHKRGPGDARMQDFSKIVLSAWSLIYYMYSIHLKNIDTTKFGGKGWVNKWFNHKAVCRTALATPGLLKIQHLKIHIRETIQPIEVCGY